MSVRIGGGIRKRQQGAVGSGLILLMIAMAVFLALAVDTGRLFWEIGRAHV